MSFGDFIKGIAGPVGSVVGGAIGGPPGAAIGGALLGSAANSFGGSSSSSGSRAGSMDVAAQHRARTFLSCLFNKSDQSIVWQ